MKISMIMPVYNEAILLPHHLELAAPYIDEIIIVDGSPYGPSTDGSQDIARQYNNVKIVEGVFEKNNRKGGWDKAAQLQAGKEKASGDILIILSVDTLYDDYAKLSEILHSGPEWKLWYCPSIEFFIDTNHLRLVMQDGGFPLPQMGYTIVARDIFSEQEPSYFKSVKVEPDEMVYLYGIVKYHYGWITDFDIQVQKHIRNIKTGWWGEYGEGLLKMGIKGVEVWAITHVLNYTKEIVFPHVSLSPHPLKTLEFNRLNKFDIVLKQFKNKYGVDYYDCL